MFLISDKYISDIRYTSLYLITVITVIYYVEMQKRRRMDMWHTRVKWNFKHITGYLEQSLKKLFLTYEMHIETNQKWLPLSWNDPCMRLFWWVFWHEQTWWSCPAAFEMIQWGSCASLEQEHLTACTEKHIYLISHTEIFLILYLSFTL